MSAASTSWLVELEVLPSDDWLLLGPHRQQLRLPLTAGVALEDAVAVLTWKLVPLTVGHVPLPAITLLRLPEHHGDRTTPLPPPPYLSGSTVLVTRA